MTQIWKNIQNLNLTILKHTLYLQNITNSSINSIRPKEMAHSYSLKKEMTHHRTEATSERILEIITRKTHCTISYTQNEKKIKFTKMSFVPPVNRRILGEVLFALTKHVLSRH